MLPLCIVGYWLLRNFLNQYQINLLPTHRPPYFAYYLWYFLFAVCLWELPQWCSIACLKQDYLWFLGKPNYSIFEFENFFFLFSLLLSSNLIEFIIIFYEYRLIRNCHFYWPWWEGKRNHLETLEEVAWQFFCPQTYDPSPLVLIYPLWTT